MEKGEGGRRGRKEKEKEDKEGGRREGEGRRIRRR